MLKLIKINLIYAKKLKLLFCFNSIVMILFILIMYFNRWNGSYLFLQMTGASFKFYNILIVSVFLITNASVAYLTFSLIIYDYKKTEFFLRVKDFKKWLMAKILTMVIIDFLILIVSLVIYKLMSIFLGDLTLYLNFKILLVSYLKNLCIQGIIVITYFCREVYYGNNC